MNACSAAGVKSRDEIALRKGRRNVELPTRNRTAGIEVVLDAGGDKQQNATAQWAVAHLTGVLESAGLTVGRTGDDPEPALRIVAALSGNGIDHAVFAGSSPAPASPESFAIVRPPGDGRTVGVIGADGAGLAYGVLELADIAALSDDPLNELLAVEPVDQSPATIVRSISRLFVSDVEDKPWFYDRDFWTEYLTELATHRINRLQLGFGMQYNYGHDPDQRDNYFCFPYPFLLHVPGYDVRADNVSDEERQRNLETLRFVSDEAKLRGIHFQLGLWNHAYQPLDSPRPRYRIRNLRSEDHAAYSAAALALLLQRCPSIDGLTLRVHYEGGIPETVHEPFWRTVMAAVTAVDRPIEIDMHAKGVDEALIDIARSTGAPVVISAKYWAEHMGLPYHQTSIREREKAPSEPGSGMMAKTEHLRRFTRYGFGDFLREDRNYDLMFRFWPGTQRLLLWGDPVFAAGYGRFSTIGGSLGVELCEPLSFKGRKDSGQPGGRDPYADPSLQLGRDDWKKYAYTYRLWGRLLYDPGADPSTWRRYLRKEFGAASESVERALGSASRVLPLVTTVHGIGASNNGYWPEMYINMPIAHGARSEHYDRDTVEPKTFGGVSSFDPMLFDRIDDHADDLVAGRRSGRYTPTDFASWLERLADDAEGDLEQARAGSPDTQAPAFRRMAIDVTVQVGLARFFAGKTRAGLSYALFDRTGAWEHLGDAVASYEQARDAFARVVEVTTGIYREDITFGERPSEHGHWADRLPAIVEDVAALTSQYEDARAEGARTSPRDLPVIPCSDRPASHHEPATEFVRGAELPIVVGFDGVLDGRVVLHYRHLNQGEEYQHVELSPNDGGFAGTIPDSYTDSPYPLTYFFTVHDASGDAWLVPGFDETLANQPYHIVRQRR